MGRPRFLTDLAVILKTTLSVLPRSVHDPSIWIEPAILQESASQMPALDSFVSAPEAVGSPGKVPAPKQNGDPEVAARAYCFFFGPIIMTI